MSTPERGNPVHWLAFGLGAGLAPKAPGTFGTLAAVPLWWVLTQTPLWSYAMVTLAATVIGIGLCGRTARDLGVHDHPGIVWDEVTGFLITMFAAPASPASLVTGFVVFRVFDIIKPWPIGWLDARVGGGLGIMADDVLAGIYAAVVLQLLLHFVL